MRPNALVITLAAIVLAFLALFAPMEARAYCGPTTTLQTFAGGHIVERICDNRRVDGVGSTLTIAQTNNSNFITLTPTRYCRVTQDPVFQFVGGYRVTFQCTDIYGAGYRVSGLGSTATDAGQNALTFGQLYTALDDVACHINDYDISAFAGGFRVNTSCNKVGLPFETTVTGIGSTATDAGINARGFAELVATGTSCLLNQSLTFSGGLYKATYSCDGHIVYGYGSSVTSAGNDALTNANMLF